MDNSIEIECGYGKMLQDGKVTIPLAIRTAFDIKKGDVLKITIQKVNA